MKKILLIIALGVVSFTQAQIDTSINPLGAIFGRPEVAGEYIVSENFGVELGVGFAFGKAIGVSVDNEFEPKQSGFGIRAQGKYYFSPDEGGDGFYLSAYVRQESLKIEDKDNDNYSGFKRSVVAGGLTIGKKWVFDSNLFIEAAIGGGRAFSEKNEWIDSDNNSEDFGVELGFDITGKFAVGYRFN